MVSTTKWGPPGWEFLHAISAGYPVKPTESDKKHYKNLFHSLAYTLPCPICRESYKVFLKHLPISLYLSSRDDLMIWVYELHNMVNQKLIAQGAKIKIPPYPKVKKKYLSWLA
jgi:Erv1 / Alr family